MRVAALLLALAPALGSCGSLSPEPHDLDLFLGPSVFPNIGLAAGGHQVVTRAEDGTSWAVEFQGHWQPLDDEVLHDDGYPAAGTHSQVFLGARRFADIDAHRSWSLFAGLAWFRAGEFPNFVQDPGDYMGLQVGWGLRTRIAEGVSVGPDLSIIAADQQGSGMDVTWIPQLTWTVHWSL